MKQIALDLAAKVTGLNEKRNILREYIQACALASLHGSGAFTKLSFMGGTALRFLYALPRFSEDLDFSLEDPDGYAPREWMEKLKRDLGFQGFSPEVTWNESKTVNVAWIRVPALLAQAGIVTRTEQKLSIKIEIDTAPPAGAAMATRVIQKHFLFGIRHHDLPSLMAGKIRAIITRDFTKGRDWYDLLWYLSRRPPVEPNPTFLRNALAQGQDRLEGDRDAWKPLLTRRIEKLDFKAIVKDVQAFLEHPEEARLLNREYLLGVIQNADAF